MGVSFLPSVCDSFRVSTSSLGQRCRSFFSRIVWTIHGRVLQEWTRCFFFKKKKQLSVFFVPTMFSGILGFFSRNSTVLSVLVCMLTQAHCCMISLVSRVLHVFSISLCGSLFLEPLFARVGVLFMYMGARESCLRACATLLYHARVKTIGTSLCLTSSSLIASATITERS